MNRSMNITSTCPMCRKTAKPKLRVHELEDDRIIVVEQCGYCRAELGRRTSTDEIERIRKDILNLVRKIEGGETFLIDVLNARRTRYNMLTATLKRNENN